MPGTRSLPAVAGPGDSEGGLDVGDRPPGLVLVGTELAVAVRLDEHRPEVATSHRVLRVLQRPLQVLGVLAATLLQAVLGGVVLGLALTEHRLDVLVGGVGRRRRGASRQRGQVGLRRLVIGMFGCPVLQAARLVLAGALARSIVTDALLCRAHLARSRVLGRHARADPDVGRADDEHADGHNPEGCYCDKFFHWNLFLATIYAASCFFGLPAGDILVQLVFRSGT